MTYFQSLSAAGFAATAISYGPGRMGFGLFVPEFRSEFAMSTTAIGFVSSLGFFGFFLGLIIAQALLVRRGPVAPVVIGLSAATTGLAMVALAPGLGFLAAGVFLAASSAGFAWTPFNDAVHRKVYDNDRPAALSRISTGTSIGIAGAGIAALIMLLTGMSWRVCWGFFALASAVALIGNHLLLHDVEPDRGPSAFGGWRTLLHREAHPLYGVAFVYGTISAIFIAFAGDHLQKYGGAPGLPAEATPALVFIIYGLFGLTGLATGRVKAMVGLPWLIRFMMLAGALSLGFAAFLPGSWAGLVASAGLQGLHVMMTSAMLAFWSERLFPQMPARGFTAALLAAAAGSVLGPALAGMIAEAVTPWVMFVGVAALPLIAILALRERHICERPPLAAPG